MATEQKKRKLTDEELRECAALNAIYKAKKKELGVTQEKIAIEGLKATTQSAASHYLTGKNALNMEAARVFARYLKVRIDEFSPRLHGEWVRKSAAAIGFDLSGAANVKETAQPYRDDKEYPLISWVAAGSWQEACDNFHPGDADTWLSSDIDAGECGYWLEVKGPSMQPVFTPGMRILVRAENFDLVSGKFYVARLESTGETTFKQYLRDGGASYLQPLNSAFPIIPITDDVRIIGRVVDVKMPASLL
ncbi:hypothetical protein AX279_19625 [Pseudomonas sp. J237]|nr:MULTISPECIES: XRE family transcriptional regulator [Pseudomonas]OEO24291.1 hypothetical protein AX279_19625 [Pseudomonas sp. J237]